MISCREKNIYIKISAVDTIWSWLSKCELSANLAEKTNCYTDNRGIKSLNAGVTLCLVVLTRSFAVSSKVPDACSLLNRAVPMGFLSISHMQQVLQCLVIFITLPWSGCLGALWWSRGWATYPLGCFTDSDEIKCLEQRDCRGCYWGLQILTFSGHLFLDSVLVSVLWRTSVFGQQPTQSSLCRLDIEAQGSCMVFLFRDAFPNTGESTSAHMAVP